MDVLAIVWRAWLSLQGRNYRVKSKQKINPLQVRSSRPKSHQLNAILSGNSTAQLSGRRFREELAGVEIASGCSTMRKLVAVPSDYSFCPRAPFFQKLTRDTQKISKTSGSMVRAKYKLVLNKAGDRCCPSPTVVSNLSGRFEGPRKNDPAAMNSPKHMRQRCRAMRFAPRTRPRTSMRTSPAAASSITEPPNP